MKKQHTPKATASPTAGSPARAPSGGGPAGPGARTQRTMGNAAVIAQIGGGAPGGPPRGGGAGGGFKAQLDALEPRDTKTTGREAMRGPSTALPHRAKMEQAFGMDLGFIRAWVGVGDLVSLGAGAVQDGEKIAFADDNPAPEQVAHEVGHVLQQHKGGTGGAPTTRPGDASEREASDIGAAVAAGQGAPEVTGGKTGELAMDWLDSVSAEGDRFWDELRSATATELTGYLANIHGTSVQNWVTFMQTQGAPGAGSLVVDAIIAGISLAGPQGAIAAAVMGTAKNIWMYVQAQSPEGLEFNDFVQAQGQAQAQAQASITDRSHAAFAAIDTARATETPENRATVRASALANARSGRNAMPDYQRIQQGLVSAWMDGAKDGWDIGDRSDVDDAGYFYITGLLVTSDGAGRRSARPPTSRRYQAQVDDVGSPDGTIASIQQAWGRSTPLHNLPFAIDLQVRVSEEVTNRGFDRPVHGMKPSGAGAALQFEEGEALDRSAYLAHPATTADLVTD